MKIVHINTYDGNGGAGRAVLRLNKALKDAGADSSVLCLYQFNPLSGVSTAYSSLMGKLKAVFNIFSERYLIKPYLKNSEVPFSLQRFGFSIADHPLVRDADIVHLHWLNHGFLTGDQLKELAHCGKKVVWTLHDANPVTGGCHVRYECENYQAACGNCPVLKNPSERDLSNRTWRMKKDAYNNLDVTFVAPSKWMQWAAESGSLTNGKKTVAIFNSLEMDVFSPQDKQKCRKALGIDPDKKMVLAGFMPTKFSRHKGFPELLESLKKLRGKESIVTDSIEVVFFGSEGEGFPENLPVNVRFTGTINSDQLLAKYYSAADVFLMSSLEESMGYTALESLACGTPVVAFNTSGVRDVVQHGINGYMANLYDTDEFADGIKWVLNHADPGILSANSRNWAVEHFNPETIANQHLMLYKSL